ncbi:hypothetical protein [Acetivibrio cellulolyticus]|uniref:hypothetical protein n=1 Tax=Acetivibrio cellulolyticus TaxID=35830 RepID=UPI0001E3016A|nr:hypothetical protein [Acetivibrio cellulolyticus]
MKEFFFKANNKNTKVKIEGDKIVIERAGIDFAAQRIKGIYEFNYSDIIKIRFKEAGLLSFGYLQLITKGNEKIQEKNLGEICSGDRNSILFKKSENKDAYALKEIIEERLIK